MKKKTNTITLIILVILIVGGIWYFEYNNSKNSTINQPEQTCTKQGGYCIYNNIPSYLQYSSPEDYVPYELDEELRVNPRDYFSDFSGLTEVSEIICKDNNKKAIIIEYFYFLCEGQEELEGCGYERRAILCEENYFINDFSSSWGPRYFGPFEYSIAQ